MYKIVWTPPKVLYSFAGAIISFTQDIHSAMLGLLICIAIDTITGFIAAPHRPDKDGNPQIRSSLGLKRLVPKIITYFTAAIVMHIGEYMVLPTYLRGTLELSRMAFTVFSAIEIYSIIENLRDITHLRALDILTMNFKKRLEEKTGIDTGGIGWKRARSNGRRYTGNK